MKKQEKQEKTEKQEKQEKQEKHEKQKNKKNMKNRKNRKNTKNKKNKKKQEKTTASPDNPQGLPSCFNYHSRQPPTRSSQAPPGPRPQAAPGPHPSSGCSLSLSLWLKRGGRGVMVVMVVASRQSQDQPKQRASLHVKCPYCILKLLYEYNYIYQGLSRQTPRPSKLLQYHSSRQPPDHPKQRASLHVECPYCILKLFSSGWYCWWW